MKATKVGGNQLVKQKTGSDKSAQAMVQASHMAEQETDSQLESDEEPLNMDLLLNMENNNA